MSDELTPCPFCGGEAKAFFCEESGTYDVQCQQCGALPFLGRRRGPGRFKSMDDVIAAWNRRAERTCRMTFDDVSSSLYGRPMLKCSKCGACVPREFSGPYNYCPNCGTKVVGER